MSSEEYNLRGELEIIVADAEDKLAKAKQIFDVSAANPQDLTRDELVALKQTLLDAYLVTSTTMAVIKKMNANSKAQSSSVKLTA